MSVTRMLRSTAAVVLVAALLAPGAWAAGTSAPPRTAAPAGAVPDSVARSGRVLIRWTGAASARASSAQSTVRAVGTAAGRAARFVRLTAAGSAVYDLGAPLGAGAPQVLDRLRRLPGVARVEPDLWMTHTGFPSDPYTMSMWGMMDASSWSRAAWGIGAPAAWRTTTGTGVRVAVIDTGILPLHPDLIGQTVAGYDFIVDPTVSNDGGGRDSNPEDPGDWSQGGDPCTPFPSSWHGTHVAGTIAAIANNGQGVFGGAPGVKILPVRVLGTCGGYSSDIADAITWASGGHVPGVVDNTMPARVLNLSLGGESLSCLDEYDDAIAGARSRGSVIVVAAGNSLSGQNASGFTPANCPGVITVAAINKVGKRATFSNYGVVVDVAGPGVSIKSTLNSGTQGPNLTEEGYIYADYQGTSMATPHVALTAALLIAVDPTLTPDEVEALIKGNTRTFAPDVGPKNCTIAGNCGAGIVNARLAIRALLSVTP